MKKDSLIYTVIFSFSITFIFVFILSLAASFTEKRVQAANRLAIARAYLLASGVELTEGSDVQKIFQNTFDTETPGAEPLTAEVDGNAIVVSPFSGEGLWGTITGVIAVENSFKRIVGIEITSHSETPGLGGRIEEEWFKDQFKGESILDDIKVVQSGGMGDTDPDNGILDGITGATRTSESMQNIINRQIRSLKGEVSFEETLSEDDLLKYSFLSAADVIVTEEESIAPLFSETFFGALHSSPFIEGEVDGRRILAASFTSPGLWGDISGVLVLDSSTLDIVGLEIVSHMEKAGAGISELWFKDQFRGLKTKDGVRVVQGEESSLDKELGVVDGISGATTTNLGIQDGINGVLNSLRGGA